MPGRTFPPLERAGFQSLQSSVRARPWTQHRLKRRARTEPRRPQIHRGLAALYELDARACILDLQFNHWRGCQQIDEFGYSL